MLSVLTGNVKVIARLQGKLVSSVWGKRNLIRVRTSKIDSLVVTQNMDQGYLETEDKCFRIISLWIAVEAMAMIGFLNENM